MNDGLKNEKQFKLMTETPIPKLITKLAIPTTISMLVTSIYSLADTFFVSQLSTSASGAVGIVFSVMTIIQAIGFSLGMGSGSLLARRLGEKDKKSADMYASSAFFTALFMGLIISVIGLTFTKEIIMLLGATDTIAKYAASYAKYIFISAPVMCSSFVLNNILRSEGKSQLAMIGLCIGGFINIGLDPLFIFTLKLETAGAAIATMISQIISFVILLSMFLFKKSNISLRPANISKKLKSYYEIVLTGLPSLGRQGLASVATVLLNRAATAYGDEAIAAMSIVTKVCMLVMCICIGIGHGFMPVIGFNYGAKLYKRVRQSFYYTLTVNTAVMFILGIVLFIFSPFVMRLFRADDAKVIEIGARAMRAQCVAMGFMGVTFCTNAAYQSLGKSIRAFILSCCRQGIFFTPLILILPHFFGILGIEYAQPIADILTCLVSIPFAVMLMREIKKDDQTKKGAT